MEYRVAICDDEAAQREYLARIVKEWAKQNHIFIENKEYISAEAFLFDYEEEKDFDILLLDIEMDNLNGVALAKRLRQENETLQIIFVTGYPDYLTEGYEVAALHYLIKPVCSQKLIEVLNRALQVSKKERPSLLVSSDRETLRIPISDIYYAEAQGHYMIIHTIKEEYRIRMTVSEIMEKLGDGFYRCSRSYVVGLRYVNRITKNTVIMENKISLPLGRGQYDDMNLKLIRYLRIV